MDTTANYKLKKPSYEEFGDVDVLNENADIIDVAIKEAKDAAENIDLSQIEQSVTQVKTDLTTHLDEMNQFVTFKKTSNQAIASTISTDIDWNTLNVLNEADYATLVSNRINLKKGIYRLDLTVTFTLNGVGIRELQIGTSNAVGVQAVNTTNGNATIVQLNTIFVQEQDGALSLKAYQNSGASISLATAYTQANIQKVGDLS